MMSRYSPLHLLRLTACSFALAAFAPALVSAAPAATVSTSTTSHPRFIQNVRIFMNSPIH